MVEIKSPRAKDRKDYETEGEISRIWYEKGLDPLMKEATEAQNRIIGLPDGEEKDTAIREYEKAQDIVNQKVEEVFGKMEGVKITTTEMSIGSLWAEV